MRRWWSTPAASRLLSLVPAAGSGAILAIAMWLDPDPSGHGTHLQLGLSPCTMLQITGFPCPMCGMTTTFTLMAHLRWIEAAITQPFGVALFLGTVITFGISAAEVIQPRLRWHRLWAWIAPREGWVAGMFLLGLSLGWIYKIWVMNGTAVGAP